MYCYDNDLLRKAENQVQESNSCNEKEQKIQYNQLQDQMFQKSQWSKNVTEKDIRETKFNGHWTKEEHKQYLEFVNNHYDIFTSKYDKKSKRILK
ncbi:unnamed protein product [Paramecium octaurelia]|uniref:Uncharacterized protein n=1 Tax=Paramecium octaurelia TaxID=43137 RepID=A0A8S1VLZ6_PAROT|nr:unnamed protein product [Paramecium octaurelia]